MIALIPARGGSKGLLGKNIKMLNGKPLIAYTIEAALKAKKVSRVIVSTDSLEIANISKEFGAEIPFMRPSNLATDNSTSLDVFRYTLTRLEKEENIKINNFIVLQPTSPLRNHIHIDEAIINFYDKKANAVVSYCEQEHPIFWNKYIAKDGKLINIFEGNFIKNRQEIKKTYYPNGAIYIFNKNYIFNNSDYTKDTYAYLMDRKHSIDIDEEIDFDIAEMLLLKN